MTFHHIAQTLEQHGYLLCVYLYMPLWTALPEILLSHNEILSSGYLNVRMKKGFISPLA
jgi:hypothetical protein